MKKVLPLIISSAKFLALTIFLFVQYLTSFESLFMPLFMPLYVYLVAAIIGSIITFLIQKYIGFLISIIFLVLTIAVPSGINYSGYCLRQNRFVTAEEKIHEAVKRIHRWTNRKKYWLINGEQIELISYDSAETILDANPDCCGYKKIGRTISPGWKTAEGHIWYETQYKAKDGSIDSTKLKATVYYNNCGVEQIVEELRFGDD